jgi:DNA-binding MarR family transcriptional regulator
MQALAIKIGVTPATASDAVRVLVDKGLVQKNDRQQMLERSRLV